MTILPIEPEPFNPKSFISWLIKIIIPVAVLGIVIYFIFPEAINNFNECGVNCSNWW